MSDIYPSQIERDHQFFDTLKRYAQRLSQEKNISLSYLQTINKLTAQMTTKDQLIQKLLKQNSELKQKLNLYTQVMSRSRILLNNGNKGFQNNNFNIFQDPNKIQSSPVNYANMRMSNLIQKQKITQSFLQTRNQLEYLKQFDTEEYQKLQSKIRNTKQSVIMNEKDYPEYSYRQKLQHDKIIQKVTLKGENEIILDEKTNGLLETDNSRVFPLFQDFIIIKPTQNTASNPDNLNEMKFIFTLEDYSTATKGNKILESISTYLCHNSGSNWIPQEYKSQMILNSTNSNKSTQNNSGSSKSISSSNDNLYIYLSNSEQTLMPVQTKSKTQPISEVYLEFNPSLYFFGICYKSNAFEYINGKIHKIPLVYCFVTRYPFLTFWRQFLQTIVQRMNANSEKQLSLFRDQMISLKNRSLSKTQGMFTNIQKAKQFSFKILQKQFKLKKLFITKNNINQQQSQSENKQMNRISLIKKNNPVTKNSQNRPQQIENIKNYYADIKDSLFSQMILQQLVKTFASYNIELIIDVLLLLLLEIPIAVVSKDQCLLQKFMLYFVYIIKPLKYPFPIIFNLPSNMTVVLQSPFPSFLGITDHKTIQPYIFQRTVFDLDQKIAKSWPNIEFYNQARDAVVKWISRMIQNEQKQTKIFEKINQIVKILISSSKSYPQELKQLKTYRKYFKKTQIWHIYNHSIQQKNVI